MRALFACLAQGLPWVDTAQGCFDLGMSLPMLAALAVFGLGLRYRRTPRWRKTHRPGGSSRSRRRRAAAEFHLCLPLLSRRSGAAGPGGQPGAGHRAVGGRARVHAAAFLRWAGSAGVLLGAVVLVHGSELYSLALVLPVVLLGSLRRVSVARAGSGCGGRRGRRAGVRGAILADPVSLGWQRRNGLRGQRRRRAGGTGRAWPERARAICSWSSGWGPSESIFPVRVVLLAIGVIAAFRLRVGRSVVVWV